MFLSGNVSTGAVAISMHLASKQVSPLLLISQILLGIAITMFLLFMVLWTIRFFKYSKKVKKEWKRHVKGIFFSTMPISLIVIGVALEKFGLTLFPSLIIYPVNTLLLFVGIIGIFLFGWIALSILSVNKKTDAKLFKILMHDDHLEKEYVL